jgi:L-aspartate oxidase
MLADDIHDYYKKSTLTSEIIELRNIATTAKLIIRSAMNRKNSIGLHYNIDHPYLPKTKDHIILESGKDPYSSEFENIEL